MFLSRNTALEVFRKALKNHNYQRVNHVIIKLIQTLISIILEQSCVKQYNCILVYHHSSHCITFVYPILYHTGVLQTKSINNMFAQYAH